MFKTRAKKKWLLMGAICCLVLATTGKILTHRRQNKPVKAGGDLGFRFEMLDDTYYEHDKHWDATIYLPEENYNEENLKRLFLWYTKLHPNKSECIKARVTTRVQNGKLNNPPTAQENSANEDAHYWRTCDERCNSELFVYTPNPNDPNEGDKRVILRGDDPHLPPKDLKYWNYLWKTLKIRYRAFAYEVVEPKGSYYAFEHYSKEYNEWHCIFTLQKDGSPIEPTAKVQPLNDKVAYTFFGWKYAVTVDGGATWQVWDAEEAFPDWECCNPSLIQSVQLAKNGTGEMMLADEKIAKKLFTKDFGQHWSRETP